MSPWRRRRNHVEAGGDRGTLLRSCMPGSQLLHLVEKLVESGER
jgi:hypothetical protein